MRACTNISRTALAAVSLPLMALWIQPITLGVAYPAYVLPSTVVHKIQAVFLCKWMFSPVSSCDWANPFTYWSIQFDAYWQRLILHASCFIPYNTKNSKIALFSSWWQLCSRFGSKHSMRSLNCLQSGIFWALFFPSLFFKACFPQGRIAKVHLSCGCYSQLSQDPRTDTEVEILKPFHTPVRNPQKSVPLSYPGVLYYRSCDVHPFKITLTLFLNPVQSFALSSIHWF